MTRVITGMGSAGDLARLLMGEDEASKPMPVAEAQIATLKECAALYERCTFNVGDVVRYRDVTGVNRIVKGRPLVIVEILDGGFGPDTRDRLNVRVMLMDEDHEVCCSWAEHWMLEKWNAR